MSQPSPSPIVTEQQQNIIISETQSIPLQSSSDNSSSGLNTTLSVNTSNQKQEAEQGVKPRRNSSRLIPLPTPPKPSHHHSESSNIDVTQLLNPKNQSATIHSKPTNLSSKELEGLNGEQTTVRNAKPSTTELHNPSTKKKDHSPLLHSSASVGCLNLDHQHSHPTLLIEPITNIVIDSNNSDSTTSIGNSPTRVRALSCNNSETTPSIEVIEQQAKPRTMSINSISSLLSNNNQQQQQSLLSASTEQMPQQQPHTRSKSNCSQDLSSYSSSLSHHSCPLPNSNLSHDHHVVFSQSFSPPKSSKVGVPIMKKYPSMKDDLLAKSEHNYNNNNVNSVMDESDYVSIMKSNETLCMDCRNIGCKCIVVTISNDSNREERDVALDLIGTVLLTSNRIVFLIDVDMSLNQYPTNGQALPKMIEVQLANIEIIEKNPEKNMCMTVTEKSDTGNGEYSPPPIRLIKKYEFFAFDSTYTFQRAFKTFNDMLNVVRLETANGKVTNHLQHVKSKDALSTLKKSYLSKKRVSVDQQSNSDSSTSTSKKFLSPLEEALANNLIERKIFTPPSSKSNAADSKHRRSISLSSPVNHDNSKHFSNGHSDLSDYEERRTFISDHGGHGSTSLSEHSADETEPKKRRSKKKDKSAIPTLSIEPPSQAFDEQFDCMVDEIVHNFTNHTQVEVNDIFKPTDKKNPKMKTLVTKPLVGISAAEVFQLFFASNSNFLRQAHEKVGDQEIEIYDWVDFQIGTPSVRGITYKVGGSYPNYFSAFTQNASRILETQRIVVMENPPKLQQSKTMKADEIPMSYFILFTSGATQDLPNNQMFQFDVKYVVKDVKPSNLLLRKECEIQISGTAQCKGGTFFWRSKSTESSVLKAVKNRLLLILNLMEEQIRAIVEEKRNTRVDQQSKAWEATVMSTMVSLDGGFPKDMPPLDSLLPPPQCLDSSPPPTPRKLSDEFSDSSDDDLTYGSTISMVGSDEPVSKRVKTVGQSSTSHLTITPPVHSLSSNSLDMSPTFDPKTKSSKKTVTPSPLTTNIETVTTEEVIGASHSSLTITDERPRQLTSPGPLLSALWGFLMMVMEQAMGYISTILSYLVKEVVEPGIKLSWDMRDVVFTIIILVIVFSLLFTNNSAINRLDGITKEAHLMQREVSLKYSLSKSIIHKIMDPDSTQKTPKEMEQSIRELVKDYLFENRKLHTAVVQKKDLISQMINFKQSLNERRNKIKPTTKLIANNNSTYNTITG
ncbi:predicted protein [Naegleria gruberi]|uniref:Predicted protein n=1 Tax=Naegleria gruberi TaxID=5762 RepID=D2V7C1_NAEGR|nr:uncharacterized protein NAEGRDRAFT_64743 [Naegleria gruberi]EFC47350.1 predicted protein [Naegleria gruberi]|eukprot:XP_002680094.1 predicted protein [Naegleria gruberi strain NEG-M]